MAKVGRPRKYKCLWVQLTNKQVGKLNTRGSVKVKQNGHRITLYYKPAFRLSWFERIQARFK